MILKVCLEVDPRVTFCCDIYLSYQDSDCSVYNIQT